MKDFDEWLRHYEARTGRFSHAISNPLHKVNKRRKLKGQGSINIPLNNAKAYKDARKANEIYVVRPLDDTSMQYALESGLMDKVVFGLWANAMVEGIVVDKETGVPWTIPKVTVEYRRIDYAPTKRVDSKPNLEATKDVTPSPGTIKVQPSKVEKTRERHDG